MLPLPHNISSEILSLKKANEQLQDQVQQLRHHDQVQQLRHRDQVQQLRHRLNLLDGGDDDDRPPKKLVHFRLTLEGVSTQMLKRLLPINIYELDRMLSGQVVDDEDEKKKKMTIKRQLAENLKKYFFYEIEKGSLTEKELEENGNVPHDKSFVLPYIEK